MQPKLVVHCENKAEVKELLGSLERLNFKWNGDGLHPTKIKANVGNYIHIYCNEFGNVLRYSSKCDKAYKEFSSIKDNLRELLR